MPDYTSESSSNPIQVASDKCKNNTLDYLVAKELLCAIKFMANRFAAYFFGNVFVHFQILIQTHDNVLNCANRGNCFIAYSYTLNGNFI